MTAKHHCKESQVSGFRSWALVCTWAFISLPLSAAECQPDRVKLQVLGSGGPELDDRRASSSYLVWLDGKARVMVDAGGGSSFNFERSGANFNDLQAVLFSHLHVDHVADWPVYIKAGYFSGREQDLPVLGPAGNHLLPNQTDFQQRLFTQAWPYLREYVNREIATEYHLNPETVAPGNQLWQRQLDQLQLSAIEVNHGPIPALAWKVSLAGCDLVFSGDTSARSDNLLRLAEGADLLIAHNAIPEDAGRIAKRLHMTPSRIGEVAAGAEVKALLLSHLMNRTSGRTAETEQHIRERYKGTVAFAEDLLEINLPR